MLLLALGRNCLSTVAMSGATDCIESQVDDVSISLRNLEMTAIQNNSVDPDAPHDGAEEEFWDGDPEDYNDSEDDSEDYLYNVDENGKRGPYSYYFLKFLA